MNHDTEAEDELGAAAGIILAAAVGLCLAGLGALLRWAV
jgi:hypothetical protein